MGTTKKLSRRRLLVPFAPRQQPASPDTPPWAKTELKEGDPWAIHSLFRRFVKPVDPGEIQEDTEVHVLVEMLRSRPMGLSRGHGQPSPWGAGSGLVGVSGD